MKHNQRSVTTRRLEGGAELDLAVNAADSPFPFEQVMATCFVQQ